MTRAITCFTLLLLFTCTTFGINYTVTKIADTNDGTCDSDCSLREAIAAANASADNDIVAFSNLFDTAQTIVLSGSEIVVANNGSLTLDGPSSNLLTIDGNNASRILSIGTGVVANIADVTFTRGNGVGAANVNSGGALMNDGGTVTISNVVFANNVTSLSAGAIRNSGAANLTINNCVFANNRGTTSSGGAIQNFSTSVLTISNSTFTGNQAAGSVGGGAIQGNGQVRISNSTFHGNTSSASGGGIQSNGSLLLLTNVTITGNTSAANGGGLHRGTTNVNGFIRNSIIAGNTGPSPDVGNSAGGLQSQGNNIIGTVGTSTGWVGSDILNTNPLLSPLGFYGGVGETRIPLSGSPALNAGQNCVVDGSCTANNPPVALTTDQRGATRPSDTTVDIGAVEVSTIYRAVLPDARLNQGYGLIIVPDMNGFNYSVSSGSLPPGLQLGVILPSQANLGGVLSIMGSPTQAGTFDFSLTASNGTNSAVVNYRIIVVGTAVPATVSGRVFSSAGSSVSRALVTISNKGGVVATDVTSSFGYFVLTGIPSGQTYTLNVEAKGYTFAPVSVPVAGDVTGLEITSSSSPFQLFKK